MKTNPLLLFAALLLAGFLLTLYSCEKLGNQSTYSIKGKMLRNCDGLPYVTYELNLYTLEGFSSSVKVLGTTYTDNNGNFSFDEVSGNYRRGLYIEHPVDANTVQNWYPRSFSAPLSATNTDGGVYNMGTFYGSYTVNTVAVLNIDPSQFGSGDTLYVGNHPSHYQAVYPIPERYVYMKSITNSNGLAREPENGFFSRWGIGKCTFDSFFNNGIDTNILISSAAICTYPDTSYFDIPGN